MVLLLPIRVPTVPLLFLLLLVPPVPVNPLNIIVRHRLRPPRHLAVPDMRHPLVLIRLQLVQGRVQLVLIARSSLPRGYRAPVLPLPIA